MKDYDYYEGQEDDFYDDNASNYFYYDNVEPIKFDDDISHSGRRPQNSLLHYDTYEYDAGDYDYEEDIYKEYPWSKNKGKLKPEVIMLNIKAIF